MNESACGNGTISLSSATLRFGQAPADGRRLKKARRTGPSVEDGLFEFARGTRRRAPALPLEDNTPEGLRAFLAANAHYREAAWPEPYRRTTHRIPT